MSFLTGPFDLDEINRMAGTDPRGFMAECDHNYIGKLMRAAAAIATSAREKPVVLLSGPSGSGKTTTAGKLVRELAHIGIRAHVVSMDDYFITLTDTSHPRDRAGNIDFESPECMDIPLLCSHFAELVRGGEVTLPRFDFVNQQSVPGGGGTLRLANDEVAIFEGIHALNPLLLGQTASNELRIYASARANVFEGGKSFFKGTWIRLVRRLIRDRNFRGWAPEKTMRLWAGVRRGEKKYISPYNSRADIVIDTALAYDLPVLSAFALPLMEAVPADAERAEEIAQIHPCLLRVAGIDESLVSSKSLTREFIGGLEED